jgi:hypothetical protein
MTIFKRLAVYVSVADAYLLSYSSTKGSSPAQAFIPNVRDEAQARAE